MYLIVSEYGAASQKETLDQFDIDNLEGGITDVFTMIDGRFHQVDGEDITSDVPDSKSVEFEDDGQPTEHDEWQDIYGGDEGPADYDQFEGRDE